MKQIQEDEVLFEKTDEDPVIVATSLTSLSQATAHNLTVLNVKLSQSESDKNKLRDEIISLKEEMNKRRKLECDMAPHKMRILEQQEMLHDLKFCFHINPKDMRQNGEHDKTYRNYISDQSEDEIPVSQD